MIVPLTAPSSLRLRSQVIMYQAITVIFSSKTGCATNQRPLNYAWNMARYKIHLVFSVPARGTRNARAFPLQVHRLCTQGS